MSKGLLKSSVALGLMTLCAALLGACGQKGPLVLPPNDPAPPAPAASAPAPSSALPAR